VGRGHFFKLFHLQSQSLIEFRESPELHKRPHDGDFDIDGLLSALVFDSEAFPSVLFLINPEKGEKVICRGEFYRWLTDCFLVTLVAMTRRSEGNRRGSGRGSLFAAPAAPPSQKRSARVIANEVKQSVNIIPLISWQ